MDSAPAARLLIDIYRGGQAISMFNGVAGIHGISVDGHHSIALIIIYIILQFSATNGVTTSVEKVRWKSENHSPKDDSPTSSMQEPSDNEILKAVVQSMQSYYARQANRMKNGVGDHRDPSISNGNQSQARSRKRRRRDEEVSCYEDLGCFRDEGPFDYLDMLPLAPERIQTRFLLHTRRSMASGTLLHYANATSLYTGVFNRSNPTKMMIHGFGSSCQKAWANEMRTALLHAVRCLCQDDVNVICVDWEFGASLPNYVQAAANARLVGKQVARLIGGLNVIRGTNNTSFHLIGFSLGAHVAGFAGDEMRNISRITGLDPAAPLFEGYSTKARLDPSDADFVDVIHSNGESLLYGGLGAFDTMGHVDYYPNGGKVQAGCSNIFVGAISDLIWYQSRSADGRSLCNHRRAYKFFTDSVMQTCVFPAFACEDYEKFLRGECFECKPSDLNCGQMGYYADKSAGRGKLYLLTRDAEPFCANQFKVVVESSPGLTPTYGSLELTLINWNQVNETFELSSEWEQLVPGQPLSRVIVAQPSMTNLISAQIKYTPYKGWITNGLEQWAVDRLTLVDSFHHKYSFCRRGLPLAEGKPTTVLLRNEDCMDRNEDVLLTGQSSDNINPTSVPTMTDASSSIFPSVPVITAPSTNSIADVLHRDDYFIRRTTNHVDNKKSIVEIGQLDDIKMAASTSKISSLKSSNNTNSNNGIGDDTSTKMLNKMHFRFVMPTSRNFTTPSKGFQKVAFRQKFVDGGLNSLTKTKHSPSMMISGHRYGRMGSPSTMQLPSGAAGIVRIFSSASNRIGRKFVGDPDGQLVFVPNGPVPGVRYIQIHPFTKISGHAINGSRSLMIPVSSSRMLQGPPLPLQPQASNQRPMMMLKAVSGDSSPFIISPTPPPHLPLPLPSPR